MDKIFNFFRKNSKNKRQMVDDKNEDEANKL
jgi:hypothetical protein